MGQVATERPEKHKLTKMDYHEHHKKLNEKKTGRLTKSKSRKKTRKNQREKEQKSSANKIKTNRRKRHIAKYSLKGNNKIKQ